MPSQTLKISVRQSDVLDFPCDVLLLKYAQSWHGADMAVAKALGLYKSFGPSTPYLRDGEFKLVNSECKIPAERVLFEGVPVLSAINYAKIRQFSRSAILHLNESSPAARNIAMTMHGVNFGMDERESFLSQLAGLLDALSSSPILPQLESITFLEKNAARAQRIAAILSENYLPMERSAQQPGPQLHSPVALAGIGNEKPHVFVAMPFSPDMEDVFIFGIQGPVQESGLLCERVDMDIFTGDIFERIKSRIESARLVVADLTSANANVYLEVGYAWGKNVKVLLVCRNVDDLKFDVKGQRCLIYSSINDLKRRLSEELKVLLAGKVQS